MAIYAYEPVGYDGELVTVEVDLRRGIPNMDIVGLPDGAVKESRERIRAAIRNGGFDFPLERLLISLAPAAVRKAGASFLCHSPKANKTFPEHSHRRRRITLLQSLA